MSLTNDHLINVVFTPDPEKAGTSRYTPDSGYTYYTMRPGTYTDITHPFGSSRDSIIVADAYPMTILGDGIIRFIQEDLPF